MRSIRRRLFLDKRPPLPRLVQLALRDNEWASVGAYRASSVPNTLSSVHSPSGCPQQLYSGLFQNVRIRARGLGVSPSIAIPTVLLIIDKGGAGYSLNDGFPNLSLNSKDPAQLEHTASASKASTTTSDVSVVVLYKASVTDMRE